jgi:hypothetical protein
VEINVGDEVRFSKAHPCGGDRWLVVRTGIDIGIKCTKCGRRVMMERPAFERRVKEIVSRGHESDK